MHAVSWIHVWYMYVAKAMQQEVHLTLDCFVYSHPIRLLRPLHQFWSGLVAHQQATDCFIAMEQILSPVETSMAATMLFFQALCLDVWLYFAFNFHVHLWVGRAIRKCIEVPVMPNELSW